MKKRTRLSEIPFQQVVDALLDEAQNFDNRHIHRLSDLEGENQKLIEQCWDQIPIQRRRTLMEDMELSIEADTLLTFKTICKIGLRDEDPQVRASSIRILQEEESPDIAHFLLDIVAHDENEQVRATAASALGYYVYLGEIEEISQETSRKVENQLFQTYRIDASTLVKRRALEALGFSGREEIPPMIENAFASGEEAWIASALFAMGRSADPRWQSDVRSMLDSEYPLIRAEAARAAGELEIKSAVEPLLELLEDADKDVRAAAIWSLSQIGGEGIAEALENLLQTTNIVGESILIEDALDNLAFTEELQLFNLLEFNEDDLSEMHEIGPDNEVLD